ncbi:hypothetical protein GW17_00053830 [Ensete ventricosum]|nr:hypothetical protein GW17_00053830 [Ensete ventricosum]
MAVDASRNLLVCFVKHGVSCSAPYHVLSFRWFWCDAVSRDPVRCAMRCRLRAPEVRSLEGGDARPKKRPKLGVQKVSKSTAARRPLCERPATPRRVSE